MRIKTIEIKSYNLMNVKKDIGKIYVNLLYLVKITG